MDMMKTLPRWLPAIGLIVAALPFGCQGEQAEPEAVPSPAAATELTAEQESSATLAFRGCVGIQLCEPRVICLTTAGPIKNCSRDRIINECREDADAVCGKHQPMVYRPALPDPPRPCHPCSAAEREAEASGITVLIPCC